ncbi:MAG: DUF502 domain-containing protein [Elusimicrobia bacterium]|nr:DUF502 domain-containing protein [Elusimicrobiota bacterium]
MVKNRSSFNSMRKNETKGPVNFFRQLFISGLLVILPLWLTVWVIAIIFKWISAFSMPILSPILNIFTSDSAWILVLAKIVSFFLTLIIICFVGYFTNKVLGRTIFRYFENVFIKLPFAGSIYLSLKKLFSFFSSKDTGMNFQKVVFIPFPNKDSYCAAFSTGEQIIDGEKYITTFMPTTPNPTTGFLMLIKAEDVVESNYTVEEAIQYIISAGIIKPETKNSRG